MPTEPYLFELLVGHLDSGLIIIRIKHRLDLEPSARPGATDEVDDRLVVDQRFSLPAQTDKRKEPVLDLVPLAGTWRVVTDGDRYLDLIRQVLQVELPRAESIPVAAPSIGANQ